MSGVTGPAGRTGATGPQGAVGETGAQGSGGATGAVGGWTPFRDFWFDFNRTSLKNSDSSKVSDIVNYLNRNPDQQIGIEASNDPSFRDMNNRRVNSVRDALIQAGVPSYKIQTGEFGYKHKDRQVGVFVSSR